MSSRIAAAVLFAIATAALPLCAQAAAALPGAAPFPPDLQARLDAAVVAKGAGYRPRTRHLHPDGSAMYTNRLILEASPYLQQHAHNPVNWYPWSDEAFARARSEGKPVLLSVGYATCHWCHVMEEESFEDEDIAAYLNQHYIAIKVDREQRPDIDGVYMAAVQMMTGGGGWPMTVWLTPDRQPFYGGTYFPPHDGDRGVKVGFRTMIARINDVYLGKRDQAGAAARDLSQRVAAAVGAASGATPLDAAAMQRSVAYYRQSFDAEHGGFGSAPKFPQSVGLQFLLRYARRTGDRDVQDMVERTLEAMAQGGIYDQVGGGFHRYATDVQWRVPHFEKMLYDNALLTLAYLEAYQASGRGDLAAVADGILHYVAKEMSAPAGGFYAASDADSEGEEGKYFVWTPAQIAAVLGDTRAARFAQRYGVSPAGNFAGRNILFQARSVAEVATAAGVEPAALERELQEDRSLLYAARTQRVAPLIDTKVVASWNGLMLSALARGSDVLDDPSYSVRATAAAEALLARLRQDGRLRRSLVDGRAEGAAFLDDYAFMAQGLLDLYEATADPRWLREALGMHEVLARHFWDEENGGFFLTADDGETLLAREKPCDDGAEPSGNAVAALNLLRLAEFTGDDRLRASADRTIAACAGFAARAPSEVAMLVSALDFRLDAVKEIVIVKPNAETDAAPFRAVMRRVFLPNRIVAVIAEGTSKNSTAALVPLVADKVARDGKVTAYVCERRVCQLPTTDPSVFARQLERVAPLEAAK